MHMMMQIRQRSTRRKTMDPHPGMGAEGVARSIEGRIANGLFKAGDYLPTLRSLSKELGCAALTAQRAMRQLVDKGLVVAEPRMGYRVAAGRPQLPRTEMVAFLEETENYAPYLGDIYQTQVLALQREAMSRGWTVALVPYRKQSIEELTAQLSAMGATAVILQEMANSSFPRPLVEGVGRLGLPAIKLDTPDYASGVDHVLRDEAHGAALATEWLVRRGHRRIGWYGPLEDLPTGRRRFSGAAEVLRREGLPIDAQGWLGTPNAADLEAARRYLEAKDRPRAVLALWHSAALALARAALDLGLKLGEALEIAGWCLEEHYESAYAAACPELARTGAAATWSMADVGRTVLDRIEERRRKSGLPTVRITLPMKLREPGV